MAKKNRSTLKRYFGKGALPTEDHFADLIDSSLNMVDEGFSRSPKNGVEISLIGQHARLISFFKSVANSHASWSIKFNHETNRLSFVKVGDDDTDAPILSLDTAGRVGVNKEAPDYTLDVHGVLASHGRIGGNPDGRKSVAADGQWHDITDTLSGCHAIEVMAGVGNRGTGRYAIMKALAMNAYNPSGLIFNFLNLKKRIRYQQSYYLSRINRIKLRWNTVENGYRLQLRTNCDFGEGILVRFYLTELWFDEEMREAQPSLTEQTSGSDATQGQ